MNYLWEILLQAGEQGVERAKLHFRAADTYSPYIELSEEFLNIVRLSEPYVVEINPYYRFLSVFKNIFHPELSDYPELRKGLFQILVHQLGESDLKMGMTREEYYKKMLGREISQGIYGKDMAEAFGLFDKNEKEILLQGMLTMYRTGDNLTLFRHIMCALIPNCIVYHSNDDPYEILVYIGRKESGELNRKVEFIQRQFVGMRYHVDLYYEYHFGIIGIEDAMSVGEIAIC